MVYGGQDQEPRRSARILEQLALPRSELCMNFGTTENKTINVNTCRLLVRKAGTIGITTELTGVVVTAALVKITVHM